VATTEVMTSAVLSGIAYRTMRGDARGQVSADQVAEALEPDAYYDVEMIDLLAVENTHGATGGNVMAIDDLRAYGKLARDRGVPVHLDGARIFNASVASGVGVAEFCAEVDTMMFCVSKGLGAPIGSLLCGPADLMPEARRIKILVGGAWRQAGIMAAAGLVALEDGPQRLHEDHARARRLAEAVAEIVPNALDPGSVETNMVFVETDGAGMSALEAVRRLAALGVGATISGGKVRMVTHVDVSDDGVETAIAAWRQVVAA
jgi:threonine aldolase